MSKIHKYRKAIFIAIGLLIILSVGQAFANEANSGYLNYQEPKPETSSSWLSTIGYVISLVITFAVVIGLAYFTSRFLGQKIGQFSANADNRILATLVLGPNRSIQIVEIAGKVMVLGVTDHSITFLEEINDEVRLEKIRQQSHNLSGQTSFDSVFQKQLASLQMMSQKFPTVFKSRDNGNNDNESEKR